MILEPEDESTLTPFEKSLRSTLSTVFRLSVAIFVEWHLFDFLFSSIWMHGYIWSLNLPIDFEMSDKSTGAIVYHQLKQVSYEERFIHAAVTVFAVYLLLLLTGFKSHRGKSVWSLFRLSCLVGLTCGLLRPLQLKQRFFSSLHEGFYSYFMFFLVSFILMYKKRPSTTLEQKTKSE